MRPFIYPVLSSLVFCIVFSHSTGRAQQIPAIPASNGGAEEGTLPPNAREISGPKKTETPHNTAQTKSGPEKPDLFPLRMKLLKTISEAKISDAILLAKRYNQISPDKSIDNIITLLYDLAYADKMIEQGDLDGASKTLEKVNNMTSLPEMRRAVKYMAGRIKKYPELISRQQQLHENYLKGTQSLDNRQWLEAISLFTKIRVTNPQYLDVEKNLKKARIGNYLKEGIEFFGKKRWKKAGDMYRSVLEIDPGNPEATLHLSLIPADKIDTASAQKQVSVGLPADRAKTTDESAKTSAKPALLSGLGKIFKRFPPKYRDYFIKYYSLVKPLVAGVLGAALFFFLVFRTGKIRRYYQKIKKLNANRILYEDILESSPDRRALYPSLASIYRQLKMGSKLSWLQEMCNRQLHNTSAEEAPLWQLCLGEINQEYGNLDVALREIEQARHMDPDSEEIRQKLERLYLVFLERDPENPVWKTGLEDISSPAQKPLSPVRHQGSAKKTSPPYNKKSLPRPPMQPDAIAKITQQEKRQALSDVFGRGKQSGTDTPSPPSPPSTPSPPSPAAEIEAEETPKTGMFSQKQKRDAYEEIFGQRKKESGEEKEVEALDENKQYQERRKVP